MSVQKRRGLLILAAGVLIAISVLQQPIDYLRYDPKSKSGLVRTDIIGVGTERETDLLLGLPVQFFGAAAMGMREAVATMLWVRADEFFHSGKYDAIVPLVRLVTWLDPLQIEVYTTGAWHLDYNFVDSDQRSDRRYIPAAIKLMEEGIKNNPDIYDLYFDLAWVHYYQKIKDYKTAVLWMEKAAKLRGKDPNTGKEVERPGFVDRMLAHAYERAGYLDKAERQWRTCIRRSEQMFRKNPDDGGTLQEITVSKKNLGLLLLRRAWRYGDMAAYERGIRALETIKGIDPEQERALEAAKKSFAEIRASGATPMDTQPPIDAKFDVQWKKVKPKVLAIEGKLDLVPSEAYRGLASEPYTLWYQRESARAKWRDGCRVRILLCDQDYDYWNMKMLDRFSWEVDKTQTVMMDDAMVRDGQFKITIDMSRDPHMYPFAKDRYKLILWFNPQEAPDYIQDRIGWRGEGLTDRNYLDMKTSSGDRMIRKEYILRKSDII